MTQPTPETCLTCARWTGEGVEWLGLLYRPCTAEQGRVCRFSSACLQGVYRQPHTAESATCSQYILKGVTQ